MTTEPMTDQQQQPLWRVMFDAYATGSTIRTRRAAELRAIADAMVLMFDPWLQEHSDVADWLCAEADRAEAGE